MGLARISCKIFLLILKDENDEPTKVVFNELKLMEILRGDYFVKYLKSWLFDDRLFIKMEFCVSDLRTIIIDLKSVIMPEKSKYMLSVLFLSTQIIGEVAQALQVLHSNHLGGIPAIVHRDLKPANILVSSAQQNYRCKLADFGLAILEQDIINGNNYPLPWDHWDYTAPELCGKGSCNCKADIYSLGRVGRQLFDISDDGFENLR